MSSVEEDTLTALSQRDGAFWVALSLVVIGSAVPDDVGLGGQWFDGTLIALGMTVLTVRVLIALYRIFRTSAEAGKVGYQEGKQYD